MRIIFVIILSLISFNNLAFSKTKILPNSLLEIKVVKNWQPFANMNIFKQNVDKPYGIKTYIIEFVERENINCTDIFNNVPELKNRTKDNNITQRDWYKCQQWHHVEAIKNPQLVADLLLRWANNPQMMSFDRGEKLAQGFHMGSTMGTFVTLYSIWYNEVSFDNIQKRNKVDLFITKYLMNFDRPVIDRGEKRCKVKNYKSVLKDKVDSNTCGNMVMKVAIGTILFGLRTENQQLLNHGHDHIYVVWSQIDPDGIWVNNASRGNQNFGYTMENIKHLSFLAEIYHNLGYDLFEHKLPHGAKVHEALEHSYNLLNNFKLNAKYAKYNVGSMWTKWSKIKKLTQKEFIESDYATNTYWYKGGFKQWNETHARYSIRYKPDTYEEVKHFKRNKIAVTPNFPIPMQAMYYANGIE